MHVPEMTNDSIGYLEYWQFKVFQVMGPTDMLIAIDNPSIPLLWLADYPTDEFVDDDPVRIMGLVEVAGTREYETVGGSIEKVRVVKLASAERQAAMWNAEREATRQEFEKAEQKRFRIWTSADGKFSTRAKFLEFKGGKVVLQKDDGSKIEVPAQKLSREDQKYYRDLLRSRRGY